MREIFKYFIIHIHITIFKKINSYSIHIGHGNSFDGGDQLGRTVHLSEQHCLLANVADQSAAGVQLRQHGGLQLLLGASHIALRHGSLLEGLDGNVDGLRDGNSNLFNELHNKKQ